MNMEPAVRIMVINAMFSPALAFALHLLERGQYHAEQLYHDGRSDVRHDTQGKDRGLREGAAGEHIQKLHQAAGGELLQLGEVVRIDAGEHHIASEAIDDDKQQSDAYALAQILYAPDIFYCFYKSHFTLLFNYGTTDGCNSLFR